VHPRLGRIGVDDPALDVRHRDADADRLDRLHQPAQGALRPVMRGAAGRFAQLALDRRGEPRQVPHEQVVAGPGTHGLDRLDRHDRRGRRGRRLLATLARQDDDGDVELAAAHDCQRVAHGQPGQDVGGQDHVPWLAIGRLGQPGCRLHALPGRLIPAVAQGADEERRVRLRVFQDQHA
jgi:hypothetical protein